MVSNLGANGVSNRHELIKVYVPGRAEGEIKVKLDQLTNSERQKVGSKRMGRSEKAQKDSQQRASQARPQRGLTKNRFGSSVLKLSTELRCWAGGIDYAAKILR
ncbi:hypothetical protein BO86DRAFT_3617 [Aspergillus japonicus CBS 114.51]|uniref:Uncharacterized protein n=1 Tax=Aspergillus japonicus CBS 114.51 TaxID=1448312 RepID=A0A8T8XIV1_ASPJA|nr:hypothetical protein BO86DRAFT_3617 [Aspergillus japonicus CBS 114.51]RAH87462.1 hypothetical protein BO86DRAFT_3617 [Aspergillus japonicus CBS 114.51]